jgi:hypothetical protein
MFNSFMTIAGIIGAAIMVSAYVLLEAEKLSARDIKYYLLNGIGSFLVLVSIAAHFDSADMGGIAVEAAWFLVSVMGTVKALRRGKLTAV